MEEKLTVFVYSDERPGEYGIRQRILTDQDTSLSPTTYKILAQNLSDEASLDLIAMTPEICWIMGSIEEASTLSGDIAKGILECSLGNSVWAILINRDRRKARSLTLADDSAYVDFHEYRAVGQTTKSKLIAAALDACQNGILDLKLMAYLFDQILFS